MEQPNQPPDQEKPKRLAVLHLEFDLDTHHLAISGEVPDHYIGLDMARRLVDECTELVAQLRREELARRIMRPGVLPRMAMGRG